MNDSTEKKAPDILTSPIDVPSASLSLIALVTVGPQSFTLHVEE